MKVMEGRFEVRLISPEALAQYMKFRGFSVRTLAQKVGCSHSTVGHLRSGFRRVCDPDTAVAIERALDAPQGSLFVPKVLRIARDGAAA
jgi:transcriptional regulator with XRE-family HTH domain